MEEMLCRDCIAPTKFQRFVRSHNPLPGKNLPEPCDFCDFGHNRATVEADYAAELAEEAALLSDTSKKGKEKYARWRLARAKSHGNVQPLSYGSSHNSTLIN